MNLFKTILFLLYWDSFEQKWSKSIAHLFNHNSNVWNVNLIIERMIIIEEKDREKSFTSLQIVSLENVNFWFWNFLVWLLSFSLNDRPSDWNGKDLQFESSHFVTLLFKPLRIFENKILWQRRLKATFLTTYFVVYPLIFIISFVGI